uniref:SPARC/Testican calcium-binding domain-containing protein n=1 Tax=Magallana gigas TaxID=29159 RepID=A0A8W8JPP7_MAGGI
MLLNLYTTEKYALKFAKEFVEEKEATWVSGSSPLPCNFAAWDKNGDDHVDLEEFSSVAYPNVKEGDLALAFQSTDTDENQQISKSELHKAEIMFGIC